MSVVIRQSENNKGVDMLMRRVILMLSLGLTCGSAMAEWSAVTKSSTLAIYLEKDTIAKDGDKVQIWELIDFKEPKVTEDGLQYLSGKMLFEFDCKEGQARTIGFTSFTENMGKGTVVKSSEEATPWKSVEPELVLKVIYTSTCNSR